MAEGGVRYSGGLDTSTSFVVPIAGKVQFHNMDTVMRAFSAGTTLTRLLKGLAIGPEVDPEADQGVTQGGQETYPSTLGSDNKKGVVALGGPYLPYHLILHGTILPQQGKSRFESDRSLRTGIVLCL